MASVSFLGLIVRQGQLSPNPSKIESVMEWPNLSSQRQPQPILGFANFYRCFIWNYSKVTLPLLRFTSILKPFARVEEAKVAILQLKVIFTTASILSHPDPARQFTLEVEASDSVYSLDRIKTLLITNQPQKLSSTQSNSMQQEEMCKTW